MIVDPSVLIAILKEEPGHERYIETLAGAETVLLSAGSWIELGAVLRRPDEKDIRDVLDRMMALFGIEIAPLSVEQARIGHQAYLTYGRGNHPARLNLGDCFSYALAKATGRPLLFKGDDFSLTDVTGAL